MANAPYLHPYPATADRAKTLARVGTFVAATEDAGGVFARPAINATLCRVNPLMLRRADQAEIFDAIIRLIAVDVVYVLTRGERASEMLLHHKAMLKNARIGGDIQSDVPINTEGTPTLPSRPAPAASVGLSTSTTAKTGALYLTAKHKKGSVALLTTTFNCGGCVTMRSHRSQLLRCAPPSRHQRRRGIRVSANILPSCGVSRNGMRYPVSEEREEVCEDGVKRTVQYFERNRFEYHPEHPAPNDVQLTRYGAMALKARGEHGAGIDG